MVVKTFYVPREKTNTKHIKNWQSSPNQTNKRRYKYVCKKRLNNVLFRSGRGMEYSQHIVNSTRPFGARAAFAARYACSGRKNRNIIMWSGQMSMIDCRCKLATWKCQEPRRHAPGKQPTDATRTSIPRVCMHLVSCCICDVHILGIYICICTSYVCLEACDYTELLSLRRWIGTDTDWVC